MDKAVKKQNKKQRHEARSGQEQSIGEEQAKRGEEQAKRGDVIGEEQAKRGEKQAKRGDVIGEEQSIGEPSPDQQSVWSDPNQYRLATYEDGSGPDQDLRRAKFGCVNSLLPVPS